MKLPECHVIKKALASNRVLCLENHRPANRVVCLENHWPDNRTGYRVVYLGTHRAINRGGH